MDVDIGKYSYEQAEPAMEYVVPFPSVDDVYTFLSDAEGTLDVWEDVYEDASDARKTVVGIVAIGGKRFTINVLDNRPDPPDYTTLFCVYVDGTRVNSWIITPAHQLYNLVDNDSGRYISFLGREESESTAGPFQFVKLKTTENITKACRNSHDLENVGSVAVKMFKIENVRLKDCAAKYTVKYPALRTFPEGKEEFVSHQVQFGAPEKVPTYAVLDFDHADEVDEVLEEVFAVVFQYRSEEILKSQERKRFREGSPDVSVHSRASYAEALAAFPDLSLVSDSDRTAGPAHHSSVKPQDSSARSPSQLASLRQPSLNNADSHVSISLSQASTRQLRQALAQKLASSSKTTTTLQSPMRAGGSAPNDQRVVLDNQEEEHILQRRAERAERLLAPESMATASTFLTGTTQATSVEDDIRNFADRYTEQDWSRIIPTQGEQVDVKGKAKAAE